MPKSTKVAEGQIVEASHINTLIDDLIEHDHSSGQGQVSHADLTDGIISGTYLSHTIINKHIQGTGTSTNPDAGGGSQGVHGLPAGVSVLGAPTPGTVWAVLPENEPFTTNQYDGQKKDNYATISFGFSFHTPPVVFVIPLHTESCRYAVDNVTTSGCRVWLGLKSDAQAYIPFKILVIGRKVG